MTKANFIRQGGALVPVDEAGREVLAALKEGREICLDVKATRNPKQHRLFFALLREVCDAGAWQGTTESLLDWVKLKCFHVAPVPLAGRKALKLKSISFESMTQTQFRDFFDRAIYHICTDLLAKKDWEAFRDDFIARVEGRYADPRRAA